MLLGFTIMGILVLCRLAQFIILSRSVRSTQSVAVTAQALGALASLSADEPRLKQRILARGVLNTALAAMKRFEPGHDKAEHEPVTQTALQAIHNLTNGSKPLQSVAIERGVIALAAAAMRAYADNTKVLVYALAVLAPVADKSGKNSLCYVFSSGECLPIFSPSVSAPNLF